MQSTTAVEMEREPKEQDPARGNAHADVRGERGTPWSTRCKEGTAWA